METTLAFNKVPEMSEWKPSINKKKKNVESEPLARLIFICIDLSDGQKC